LGPLSPTRGPRPCRRTGRGGSSGRGDRGRVRPGPRNAPAGEGRVTEQASILVAEDDAVARATLARGLEQEGHRVTTAADGRRALELLGTDPFDAVLLD